MVPHIGSHRAPCSCFLKKVSFQLSSEQSIGDVRIMQLDWRRVPQVRSRGCKSTVAITVECSQRHTSKNVSWLQRALSAVGHETAIVGQVERHLPGQWLANQACHFELDMLSDGYRQDMITVMRSYYKLMPPLFGKGALSSAAIVCLFCAFNSRMVHFIAIEH